MTRLQSEFQRTCSHATRSPQGVRVLVILHLGLALMLAALVSGCPTAMKNPQASKPLRDINAVLADHDKELLAIQGVVGVSVGLSRDGTTTCLKVMLARKDSSVERRIPRALEGYPVVTEVTGEIRPLK